MYMRHTPKPLPSLASRGAKKCMFFGVSGRGPTAFFRLDLNWSQDDPCQNPHAFWHASIAKQSIIASLLYLLSSNTLLCRECFALVHGAIFDTVTGLEPASPAS